MTLNLIDRSNYFKGLLLLIRKDRVITNEEREMVKKLGTILSFDKKFVKNAINDILNNEFIIDEPPKFSSKDLTKVFIKDGIKLALTDNDIHYDELEWLKSVAAVNGLDTNWLDEEIEIYKNDEFSKSLEAILEIKSYL